MMDFDTPALPTTPGPFIRIGVVLVIFALLGAFATYQFEHAGQWLPNPPDKIGAWTATDTPISEGVLGLLGHPKAVGREYRNPLGEQVYVSIVSAGPFENYHDPTVCVPGNGFTLTARKNIPLDGAGSGKARAMVFRREQFRMTMYYWQQTRNGETDTEARMGTYKDLKARLQTGFNAVIQNKQTCLMRVYTGVSPNDSEGRQAQRNVAEISRGLYQAAKEQKQ